MTSFYFLLRFIQIILISTILLHIILLEPEDYLEAIFII